MDHKRVTWSARIHTWIVWCLGLDARSMAWLRFMLGATVLFDLYDRSGDLRAHYTDDGALPRQEVLHTLWNDKYLSFHMMSGRAEWIAFLFLVHACFAVMLMVGYRTRLSSFMVWLLMISLNARNTPILHGGDVLLRCVLFWAMLLPLDRCWSVDNVLRRCEKLQSSLPSDSGSVLRHADAQVTKWFRVLSSYSPPAGHPNMVVCAASFGFIMQVALMYITAHYHKIGAEWTTTRTAAFYALKLCWFRKWPGDVMLMFPEFLKFMTAFVLLWQWWGGMLMLMPVTTQVTRVIGSFGFWVMHFSFAISLRLDTFSWITQTAILAIMPSSLWDYCIFPLLRSRPAISKTTVYYPASDPSAVYAREWLRLILIPDTPVHPQRQSSDIELGGGGGGGGGGSSAAGKGWTVEEPSGRTHHGWNALPYIFWASPLVWWISPLLWLHPVVLRLVASAVALFSRATSVASKLGFESAPSLSVLTPPPPMSRQSMQPRRYRRWLRILPEIAVNCFAAYCVVLVLSLNLTNIRSTKLRPSPVMRVLAESLQLDQFWSMFAPRPPTHDWWYVLEATRGLDGRTVELMRNGALSNQHWHGDFTTPVDYSEPKPFHIFLRNHRWFKLFEWGINAGPGDVRLNFGRWVCREYRRNIGTPLKSWKLTQVLHEHMLDGTDRPAGRNVVWEHQC